MTHHEPRRCVIRNLLSLSVAALLCLATSACDEAPLDPTPADSPRQECEDSKLSLQTDCSLPDLFDPDVEP